MPSVVADPLPLPRRWVPVVLGGLLAGIGALVLLGWLIGSPVLVQIQPRFVPMQGNTAFCLVLVGAALVAAGLGALRTAAVLGWIVVAFAGLIFLQYLSGLDFGLDQMLFEHPLVVRSAAPGRMAPDTALGLVLAGLGLALFRRHPAIPSSLAVLTITMGAAWVLAYGFRLPAVLRYTEYTQMALHTALALVLLGVGLLSLSLAHQRRLGLKVPRATFLVGVLLAAATLVLWRSLGARVGIAGSPLPEVVLVSGLIISVLVSLTLRYAEIASARAGEFEVKVRQRTSELESILEELRKEIRERRRTETALRKTQGVGRVVSAELDVPKVVDAVTDAATELTGAAFGAFFYNSADAAGESYMLYSLAGAPIEAFQHFANPRATALFGPTFEGEAPIRIADVHDDPRFGKSSPYYGLPEGHLPVTSYLAVPVISRSGEVWGGLFFGHPEAGRFTESHEEIAVGLAAQAAIAMDNARLYEEERQARAAAQAASAAKDRFLVVLGHELRNPLGSIATALEVLDSDAASQGTEIDMRKIVQRQVRHLARLVDDLLDISRIERGKLSLRTEPLDLAALLREALELHGAETVAADLELVIDIPDEAVWVEADRTRLIQVVGNLISNAVKFTDPGGTIRVGLAGEGEDAVLRVRDSGCGLDESELADVFQPFAQMDEAQRRMAGGLGLGLPIVKGLLEAHRGGIAVTSEGRGKGSEFVVRLPLADEPTAAELESASGPEATRALRILVIDDHQDSAHGLAELLRLRGHEVDVVFEGREGVTQARLLRPDLVISDLGLPEMDGYDVARTLRADPDTQALRLIALSGYGDATAVERALAAGFNHHLTKPVDPGVLLDLIDDRDRSTGTLA